MDTSTLNSVLDDTVHNVDLEIKQWLVRDINPTSIKVADKISRASNRLVDAMISFQKAVEEYRKVVGK